MLNIRYLLYINMTTVTSDLAKQFLEAVDDTRGAAVAPMERFFEERRQDFGTLEMGADGVATGEHPLLWKEHHLAYIQLVEECLGVERFLEQQGTDERALFRSLEVLVKENPDVKMFVASLIAIGEYEGFLKLAWDVKSKTHCFHVRPFPFCIS